MSLLREHVNKHLNVISETNDDEREIGDPTKKIVWLEAFGRKKVCNWNEKVNTSKQFPNVRRTLRSSSLTCREQERRVSFRHLSRQEVTQTQAHFDTLAIKVKNALQY